MSQTPIEWPQMKLGDVADVTVGHVGSMTHEYRETGVPFLRSQNILPHRIDLTDVKLIGNEFHQSLKKSSLRGGDVVTVRTGKPGTTAVVPDGLVANCADLVIMRPSPAINSRWLSYYMNSAASNFVSAELVGAVQQHFNVGSARRMCLPIPSRSEQDSIAAVLGAIDDKIDANRTVIDKYQDLADLLFAQTVSAVPLSDQRFVDLASIGGGGTPGTSQEEFWGGNVLWATPTDITALQAPYLNKTSRMISDLGLANCSSVLYPAGSILMTSRATIGAFAFAEKPTAVNQGFIVVNSKDPKLQVWIYHEMRSRISEFISHANGATFLELNRTRFKEFRVRLPAQPVLQEFVSRANSLHRAASQLLRESNHLQALHSTLLPQLLSGKLRISDAEGVAEDVL